MAKGSQDFYLDYRSVREQNWTLGPTASSAVLSGSMPVISSYTVHPEVFLIKTSSRCRFTLTLLTLAVTVLTAAAHAQTYTVLYNFSPGTKSGDAANPQYTGIIAQGQDGNLYSTTPVGGTFCCGVLFKMTPSGTLTHVFDFNDPAGAPYTPFSGLTLAACGGSLDT